MNSDQCETCKHGCHCGTICADCACTSCKCTKQSKIETFTVHPDPWQYHF